MGCQSRSHGHSHGHGHGHHHDTTYLTSKNKQDPGVRITRIGLLANLAMAIGKGVGGYVFHSQALVADAYHALTDLVSDFMTLGTVSWSNKPPSSRFPLGYGKVETLGALGVSGLLLVGGVLMGLNAAEVILTQFFPDIAHAASHLGLLGHGHSHSHAHFPTDQALGPNLNAAWLAAGSIVVKEWLYHATMKIAKERKSSVLASNAVHHRVDSLTSIVALLTIGGAHVFTDATWLDPVGGLVISIMIIRAGLGNTKTTLLELADAGVEDSMVDSVRKYAARAIAGIPDGAEIELRNIQGVKSGPNYLMEIDLAVPGSWSVARTREIERVIRERVGSRVRGVKRLRVRFTLNTEKELDFAEEFIAPDVSPRSSPEPEAETNGTAVSGAHVHENGNRKRH
ncbi:mitochondrial metal transporter [Arthroderma uncinatum]|uniref:mitochondrial metal transporter n=1 Tax=Arthroderma uncinatum TaxID=74035 RepID=UPI00144AD1FF|nr:mitochondrial metal transporter [Arthroderma uncinatum]KAF3484007.1 mitochondrial metal transporter [Arthroderma uncinatum]